MIILSKFRRGAVIAGCAALLGLGGLATAATAVASPALAGSHVTAQGYACDSGHFCIYDGWNGTGTRCQWSDPKVRDTVDLCSFIQKGKPVHSVYNRTDHRVQYYKDNGFNNRVGSTLSGDKGNLQGNYQIRSFEPQ